MKQRLVMAAAVLLVSLCGTAAPQEKTGAAKKQDPRFPEGYSIPAADAQRTNPAKPTEPALAAAKKYYSSQCAMCHGKEGDGKGDLAEQMQLKMPDYRKPETLAKFSDGELFYILTNGMGKMPGEGERTEDEKKWQVINYLRSLSKTEPGEKPAPKP
jgi:mono/diheme cytochrome c family protein